MLGVVLGHQLVLAWLVPPQHGSPGGGKEASSAAPPKGWQSLSAEDKHLFHIVLCSTDERFCSFIEESRHHCWWVWPCQQERIWRDKVNETHLWLKHISCTLSLQFVEAFWHTPKLPALRASGQAEQLGRWKLLSVLWGTWGESVGWEGV